MSDFLTMLAAAVLSIASSGQDRPLQEPATILEDVQVTARRNADRASAFVGRVAAPARGRGLGRWREVCPGIVNLDREVAQPLADRIAAAADALGIEVGAPGCEANIVVVFTPDAQAVTRAMVQNNPRVFRHGGNGIDRGSAALNAFQASDRPIRWWSLSVPIDSETGQRAVRVPGDRAGVRIDDELAGLLLCNPNDCVIGAAPVIQSTAASRLDSQIVDQLYKSIVVVDIDAVAGLSTAQLGDYVALVTLSQIDPAAGTGAFDTVLNLFDSPELVSGLTEWDRAYLSALYNSPSRRRSLGGQAEAVAGIMNRNLGNQR